MFVYTCFGLVLASEKTSHCHAFEFLVDYAVHLRNDLACLLVALSKVDLSPAIST